MIQIEVPKTFLQTQANNHKAILNFDSLFTQPAQRLPRYHLFLEVNDLIFKILILIA